MTTEIGADESRRMVRVLRHLAAAIVTAYPVLIMIVVGFQAPDYFVRLFAPDPQGRGMAAVIIVFTLLSLGLSYGAVLLISNTVIGLVRGTKSAGKIVWGFLKIALLGAALYFFLSIALLCALMGPAMVILYQSPVGRMFFGG
jgi:hypothetical protein